jgi:predicted transcriptional regulator
MPRKTSNRPTDAELAILMVLWERGPSTVREVHQGLTHSDKIGYTTVLKTLQIMTDKGLVRRDESRRAHVYGARRSQEQTQMRLLGDLLERAYRGSASKLVVQALSSKRASKEEIEEIRKLLDRMSGEIENDSD